MNKVRMWTERFPAGADVVLGRLNMVIKKVTAKSATLTVPEGIELDELLETLGVTPQVELGGETFEVAKAAIALTIEPVGEEEWVGAPIVISARQLTLGDMFGEKAESNVLVERIEENNEDSI